MSRHPVLPQLRKWVLYYGIYRPLALLPAPLAYRAAGYLGTINAALHTRQRQKVVTGMLRLMPELERNPKRLQRMAVEHFRMLAREVLDVFFLPRIKHLSAHGLIDFVDLTPLIEAKAEGRGTIVIMSHFSRLNMLMLGVGLSGNPIGVLTTDISSQNPALSPVDRRFLKRKVSNLIARMGGRWLTVNDDIRALYKGLREGETIVILMDAYNPRFDFKSTFSFMDGQLQLAEGIERIARRTDSNLIYGNVREKGWRVEVTLTRLPDDPAEGMAGAVTELERHVREAPWQWWQWGIIDRLWTPS